MLGHRLLALRADIGDTAENIQFRHVASGAPARNLVADGAIPVNSPRRTVSGKTGDVDEVELIESALPFCAADTTSDRAILAYNVKLKRTRNKFELRSFFVTSPVSGFQMC